MAGGIQTAVQGLPATAVAGDFADANPGFRVMSGPGGLVSGAAVYGVQPVGTIPGATGTAVVGRFGWLSQQAIDPDNAATIVNSFYTPGSGVQAALTGVVGLGAPDGFISRPDSPAIITQYLSDATMVIQEGAPVPLWAGGRGFWIINDGTTQALIGQKAYANLATGQASFAASGAPATAHSTAASIAAGTWSATGTINGNVMTLGVVTGTAVPGATVTGSGVPSGVIITEQLSGVKGAAGEYAINVAELTVASEALSGGYGILTVGGTVTGTFAIGGIATSTLGSITAGTQITGLGTGAGGAGTYYVQTSQTVSSQAATFTSNVETQWMARSQGGPGEPTKMSTILQ
jgi:hypothetical protein